LAFDDARAFGDYALWAPGMSFAGYDLVAVEQDIDTGESSAEEDTVTFVYQRGNDRATQVRITCFGRLRDDIRDVFIQQRIEGSEEIATLSGPAWLWTNGYLDGVRIDLDRDGTMIVIFAPDLAAGLGITDALHRANSGE
jgi:hypothetical protein